MNLHEYQAKQLFSSYKIRVPRGEVAASVEQAKDIAARLSGDSWVVKAQVQAGGRGKAGGVKRVTGTEELTHAVKDMIGTHLVTHQTTARGLPINQVLIEEVSAIESELYLGALVNRADNRVVFMASPVGGMDIEEVAKKQPEKIYTESVDPTVGLQAYQTRNLAFALGLKAELLRDFAATMLSLYTLFIDNDLSLIEINPLVITTDNQLLALDGKINIDDNALYRRRELAQLRDPSQEDEREYKAKQLDLNYVTLDGNIGCMVNGAGLAMATMDLIKLHGGDPANFLDVGGGITAERVVEAFKLVLSDEKVKAILVNIFGGIVRCDLIAEGIIQAAKEVNITIPVIVRLEGTNVDMGKQLLQQSGLSIIAADSLTAAATEAVRAAGRGA